MPGRENSLTPRGILARVLRSGRFGVGVLAAFLVGSEIEVLTRHLCEPEGVRFKATIDTDPIELWRVKDAQIGTKVTIRITEAVFKALSEITGSYSMSGTNGWDWYRLGSPSVLRLVDGVTIRSYAGSALSGCGEALDKGWFRISTPGYQDVQWSYEARMQQLVL